MGCVAAHPSLFRIGEFAMNLMQKFWQDEAGVIVSTEIILIMMILVFGLIAGLVSLRDAVAQELGDTGLMVNTLDQSYSFSGNTNTVDNGAAVVNASTPSSLFVDLTDENNVDVTDQAPAGLDLITPLGNQEG
jgi:Flp pilus assembly pilin Flp